MNHAQIIPIGHAVPPDTREGQLLGAVLELTGSEQRELIAESGLGREDFTTARYGAAWVVVNALAKRPKGEINAATVASYGTRTNWLSPSDAGWLTDLQEANTLTRQSALQIADDLRTQSKKREVLTALRQMLEGAERRFDSARLHSELGAIQMRLATEFSTDETAADDLLRVIERWDANVDEGRMTYMPTGIRLLDQMIGGSPQSVWFAHGKPGAGKNALVTTMVNAQVRADAHLPPEKQERVGIIGLENGTDWYMNRMLAEGLGIKVRDVGSLKLTPEQQEKRVQLCAELHSLGQRIHTASGFEMTRDQLLYKLVRMAVRHGVRRFYVDNFGEVDHAHAGDYWRGVIKTVIMTRNFAIRYGASVCFLIHDTEDKAKPGQEGPPDPAKMMGGKGPARFARLVLGVWEKGSSIRCTVTKGSELAENGGTMEFKRNYEAATFDPDGGRVLDLNAEAAEDRKKTRHRSIEQQAADALFRAEALAKLKAARGEETKAEKPPEAPAQGTLLDVPKEAKP